jgi:hypothetical protein
MKSKNETPATIMLNGKPYEVTPGGSLGLLALGNIGVRVWKKAAAAYTKAENNKAPKNEKK